MAKEVSITEGNLQHEILRHKYDAYYTADKVLCTILLAAVLLIFLEPIKHENVGFGYLINLTIITHLWNTYREINGDQLATNTESINGLW